MRIQPYLKQTASILALAISPVLHAIEVSELDLDNFDFDDSAVFARIDNNQVFVNGTLDENSPGSFKQYLAENPETTKIFIGIVPGSSDDESTRELLKTVIDRGLDTHLVGEADSGGVDLWLAGRIRSREQDSIIGVHAWSADFTPGELKEALDEGDISQAFYDRVSTRPLDEDGNIVVEATEFPTDHPEHQAYINILEKSGVPNAAEFYFYTINAASTDDIHELTNEEIAQYMLVRSSLFDNVSTQLMPNDIKQALGSIQGAGIGGVLENFYGGNEESIRETLQAINPAGSSISKSLFSEIRSFQELTDKQLISSRNQLEKETSGSNQGRLWMDTSESYTRQDSENLGLGYQSNNSRISLGYDYRVTDSVLLGALYGYTKNNLDYHHNGGSNDIRGNYVGLYGMSQSGRFFTEANVLFSLNESDVKRNLPSRSRQQQARSNVDASSLSASILAGYDFSFNALTLTPIAGLSYSKVSIDNFTENGSILAVETNNLAFESYQTKLGLRLSYPLDTRWFSAALNMKSYWLHELGDTKRDYTARFVKAGDSYQVNGLEGAKDVFLTGLSYEIDAGEHLSISLNAEYEKADQSKGGRYSLQANYTF